MLIRDYLFEDANWSIAAGKVASLTLSSSSLKRSFSEPSTDLVAAFFWFDGCASIKGSMEYGSAVSPS